MIANFRSLGETAENNRKNWYECDVHFKDNKFDVISLITKAQFNELFTYCERVPAGNAYRFISKKDLLCFLCKLHPDISAKISNVIFSYSSRQALSLTVAIVRRSLMMIFVPVNIGFHASTRQDFIQRHVTEFANTLYNLEPQQPRAIVCED